MTSGELKKGDKIVYSDIESVVVLSNNGQFNGLSVQRVEDKEIFDMAPNEPVVLVDGIYYLEHLIK